MWLINLILLILLGLLGISPWLKARQAGLRDVLTKLESVEGWIGIAGLIWGIVMLLRWLSVASTIFRYAPGIGLIGLATIVIILALSLILALPQLRSLFGSNDFTNKLGGFTAKLEPFRLGLGFACLLLALYTVFMLARFRF
ncbi:MAG TPA: hypothetical protein VFN13_10275 [Rudaea sp.]|nr:hypothetical protein [Rudaea sp.]